MVVVINKKDYILKIDNTINEGIQQGKYEWTNEKTREDLEKFQHFRNFKNHPKYSDMRPVSHQQARFTATAKTHKFENHSLINLDDLKFRPIIDQSNRHIYNAAKIVSDYLQPLAHNDYVIKDTFTFVEIIKIDALDLKEEYVSYDVESLLTSIPVKETIDYIITEIYDNKVSEPICKSKLIFCCLLEKLTQNYIFRVNNKLFKQVDGCLMGGAISVIMSGIHLNRLEKERAMPLKPKFYKCYVDDTITKKKKNPDFDELFQNMISHHPNIKLTIETNPNRFLDTAFSKNLYGSVITVFHKLGKFPTFWNSHLPKRY